MRSGHAQLVGLRAEDQVGEDVELLGLADGLGGVLSVEGVAPRYQIIEKLHHRSFGVGRDPGACNHMRVIRVVHPGDDGVGGAVGKVIAHLLGGIGSERQHEVIDLLLVPLGGVVGVHGVEGGELPETRRDGTGAVVARIEDVFVPGKSVLKLLVLGKQRGDEHGSVVEDLPVVEGVGSAASGIEVEQGFAGIGRVGLSFQPRRQISDYFHVIIEAIVPHRCEAIFKDRTGVPQRLIRVAGPSKKGAESF